MDSHNIAQVMIEYEKRQMDLEWFGEDSPLKGMMVESIESTCNVEEDTPQEFSLHLGLEDSSIESPSFPDREEEEEEDQSQPNRPRLQKRKLIHRKNVEYVEYDSDEECSEFNRPVRHRRRRGDANGYPTKNFLPNFKGPHLQYLEKELGKNIVNSFEVVQEIKRKNGISMKDYESLYRISAFEKTFDKFFKTKVLFRELMISRSSTKARKVHILKLNVFEEAYRSKNFSRIN